MTRAVARMGKSARIGSLCLILVVFALVSLASTAHAATSLNYTGPNRSEFGGAPVYYQVSNTIDVVATTLTVPVYTPTKPTSSVKMDVYCMNRGTSNNQDGAASVYVGGTINTAASPDYLSGGQRVCDSVDHLDGSGNIIPAVYSIPASAFSKVVNVGPGFWPSSGSTVAYEALVPAGMAKGASGYRSFRFAMQNTNYLIGYSANNSAHFAIANQKRCDKDSNGNWIDSTGCGQYYNYKLDFAPACNESASQPQSIVLYDPDNNGVGPDTNIQPKKYQIKIQDEDASYLSISTSGSPSYTHAVQSGNPAANRSTVTYQFKYVAGDRYNLQLDGVYANNVIQFKLPFDSINHDINCNWVLNGTSQMYTTRSTTGSCSSAYLTGLADGGSVQSGNNDRYVCFKHYVTNNAASTQNSGSFRYGVRYMTYHGSWDPVSPPPGSRPAGSTPDPGGACAFPNTGGTSPFMSTSATPYPSSCRSASNYSASGIQPGHTASVIWKAVKIPANTIAGTQFCEYVAFSPIDKSNRTGGYSNAQCFKVTAPPVALSCNDLTDDISDQEAGRPFRFHVTVDNHISSYAGPLNMTITGTGSIVSAGSVSGPDASHVFTSLQYTITPGTYNVTYNLGGNPTAADGGPCRGTFTVGYKPYFNAVGGDVSAGADFGSGVCNLDGSADLKSWNNDGDNPIGMVGADYRGAGSQYAAFVGGDIASFITNAKYDATYTTLGYDTTTAGVSTGYPHALSFANDSADDANGKYGGNFGNLPCMHDYLADVPQTIPDFDGNYNQSGTFSVPDGFAIGGPLGTTTTINASQHLTLVSQGDVFISGNILYGSDGNLQDIPSFNVYAAGGIYIKGTVSQIHGVFEANSKDDTKPGVFATCATQDLLGVISETTAWSSCSSTPLDVYGSVLADRVDLDRSYKSVNTGRAAETFHYSPEEWLPTGGSCTVTGDCKFDAILGLPPVL